MRNIKLIIEYNGKKYCGWQTQRVKRGLNKNRSIQETIESCLEKLLKQKINLIASGRTDSGVHAFGQVANFKTFSNMDTRKIKLSLNGNLPKDIRISKADRAAWDFNSRYSAKSKSYRYFILNQDYKSPFFEHYSYWVKPLLNIALMRKASKYLLGRHDFKAFCASGSSVKDTTRTMKRISLTNLKIFGGNFICIEVEADGFLYNMVRNIVGALVAAGRSRFKPNYIKEILIRKDRSLSGDCVPAKGLYLAEVKY